MSERMYETVGKGYRNGIQVEFRNVSRRARPRLIKWRTEVIGIQDEIGTRLIGDG